MNDDLASASSDPREEVLRALLTTAGRVALARQAAPDVFSKPDGSEITDADLASDAVLVAGLRAAFPDDAVLSEESGRSGPDDAGAVWMVDPLDGTAAFVEGLAHWGPTVCRVVDGVPEVGGLYLPRTGEWWFASAGRGAWRDGVRLHPDAPGRRPSTSLYVPSRAHRAWPIGWRGRTRALGCSAVHLALVASGGAAATIIPQWQPWDVAAGLLMVREVGRRVTDLSGADSDPMKTGQPFLAASDAALAPLVTAIAEAVAHLPRI